MTERRTMLLDTAALYFRAFHALPETITAPDGTPVNAVRGLLDFIARLVDDYAPTDLVACWDDDWRPAWRVAAVPSYKAHRVAEGRAEEVPDALRPQVPLIRQALDALGVPVVGAPDHEADDVIGTLAAVADGPVDVVTSDRDLFQVIDDAARVRVISTAKGMRNLEAITDAIVQQRYGVGAAQYADFATLRGDPSDGLPGVAGIGEKTAATLLARFGDLDAVLAAAHAGTGMSASVAVKLQAGTGYARAAAPVVRVVTDLDLPAFASAIDVTDERREAAGALGGRLGVSGAMTRALDVLGGR